MEFENLFVLVHYIIQARNQPAKILNPPQTPKNKSKQLLPFFNVSPTSPTSLLSLLPFLPFDPMVNRIAVIASQMLTASFHRHLNLILTVDAGVRPIVRRFEIGVQVENVLESRSEETGLREKYSWVKGRTVFRKSS